MPLWEVVGGADKGGILIREGVDLKSPGFDERLSFGAVVEELDRFGDRLHYKLISGTGPPEGWASLKITGKDLLVPKQEEEIVAEEGPAQTHGPVEVNEDLKAQIVANANEKSEIFLRFVPKYKVLKFPLQKVRYRIFCFHNAGSAESNYSAKKTPFMDWVLGTGVVEVVALDYPGRGSMLREPLHNTLETLCPLLLSVIYAKIADGVPYFIWGHSVGTWVAFEVLILARKVGLPMPKAAFLNAFPAPHLPEAMCPWRRSAPLSDEQFKAEVALWDAEHFKGPSAAVFRDDQFQIYGPIMRADFQLFDEQTFKHNGAPRFDFPFHCWHMEREHFTTSAMVQMWRHWTSGKFDFCTMPMGHLSCFYNEEFKKEFFTKITTLLKSYVELD